MQRVCHDALMNVFEILEDNYNFYYICELIHGCDLQKLIEDLQKEKKSLSEYQAALIARDILMGCDYMHNLGIVH